MTRGPTKDNLLLRMTEQDWDDVINVNLKSIFNTTKVASKVMLKNRYGVFINLTSVVGVQGNAGQSNYAASKAGIIGFSKSVAKEFGSRNIRTNVVAPGFIRTEMTDVLDPKVVEGWGSRYPPKTCRPAGRCGQRLCFPRVGHQHLHNRAGYTCLRRDV